jgi:hypothetical protein
VATVYEFDAREGRAKKLQKMAPNALRSLDAELKSAPAYRHPLADADISLMQSRQLHHAADFGGLDEADMGDSHGMQRAVQLSAPKLEEAMQRGKPGRLIVVLPDISLQQGLVIGQPIDDLGRRQTVTLQLTDEIR